LPSASAIALFPEDPLPRISLCLIARNEEAMIGACLESVRGVVDEVVLVDTGSTDRTMEIARQAGARVFEQPWRDDFAAPRNEALARATGDWVLILDADERLAPGAGKALRRAIRKNADFDCGMLPLHDAARPDAPASEVLSGAARLGAVFHLPRLLRRTDGLEFKGIIHENVSDWLVRRGLKVRFVEAPIVHLGGTAEIKKARDKAARNIALLERNAAEQPSDITPLGYLAREYMELGRLDEARAVAEKGWAILAGLTPAKGLSAQRLAIARATLDLQDSDGNRVIEAVDVGERFDGPHPDFDFLRGCGHELRALAAEHPAERHERLQRAVECYQAALHKRKNAYAQNFVNGATGWAALTRLGTMYLLLGDLTSAMEAYRTALADKPDHREAMLGKAEVTLESGEPEAALRALEPLLGVGPDGWLIAASAAEALGMVDDMRLFYVRGRRELDKGYVSPHRRLRFAALSATLSAYMGAPQPGPGPVGAITALLARAPLPTRTPMGLPPDERSLAVLAHNLVRLGKADLLEALLEPRAEEVLPGAGAALRRALEGMGLHVADDGEPSPVFVGGGAEAAIGELSDILSTHPRFRRAPAFDPSAGVDEGGLAAEVGVRPLVAGSAIASQFDRLERALPRARFVRFVGEAPAATPSPFGGLPKLFGHEIAATQVKSARCLEILESAWRKEPRREIDRVLAFLGERADDAVMAALAERAPLGASSMREVSP
jgi:tetratricopeptide (TPR) repeat protein